MAQSHLLIALTLLLCAGLSACGTTGTTFPFVLSLDLSKGQQPVRDIRVESARMAPDAATLHAVAVRAWGKFEPQDLTNIEYSLRHTIAPHIPVAVRSTQPTLDVHLMIRRFAVSVSNTGGAVLASVTWALAKSDGELIYQEQFFASDSMHLIGTIGGLKDSVHKATVRRIATTALMLAAEKVQPMTFDNTYATHEEAAARLPQTMVSMGAPPVMAFPHLAVGMVGALTPSGVSNPQWAATKPSQDFDWRGYLQEYYKKP